jgi:uncharacterized protein YjbJ (UPF0337 family)
MDWRIIEGNWTQVKTSIKDYWDHLTDEDLDKIAGKREKLEGKLQEAMACPAISCAGTSTTGLRGSRLKGSNKVTVSHFPPPRSD